MSDADSALVPAPVATVPDRTEAPDLIEIEVACALPERQHILAIRVPRGTTALAAVAMSGIAALFPEVAIDPARLGIFGRLLGTRGLPPADRYTLCPGERVEIYRPLVADPKEARRRRAAR